MSAATAEFDLLFGAAAEALVLASVDDPGSIVELLNSLEAIAAWFGSAANDDSHPIRVALEAAEHVAGMNGAALASVESALGACRVAAAGIAKAETEAPTSNGARPVAVMPLAGDDDLLRDFGVRAIEHLDAADERLLRLESDPGDMDSVDAVFRAFHTIKGMAGFLALDAISTHAHASENLLADARSGESNVTAKQIQALFVAVDGMRGLVSSATGLGAPPAAAENPTPRASSAAAEPAASGKAASERAGIVRVDEARLDRLLDAIGELVIAESMVSATVRSGESGAATMQVERLDKITRELQSMATSLRMVPLRATFKRMARLVRDLAHRSGKDIEFVVSGEDTELDKMVVDRISDPLVHALRNAVDHGIESAEERAAFGKPAQARVELRAFHAGGAIHIEVADDGRGLDTERILARARQRNLIDADSPADEHTIQRLIFAPGFSTATEVTDVSGRGVGMDVVKRAVDELRGRIDVRSAQGSGTTLAIRLPITLAIIDGMVARVGDERYVIPMLTIERSVRPAAEQLTTVLGRGEMLSLDGDLIPIVRLHETFATPDAQTDPTRAVVIVINDSGIRAGLLACELLGQQQTVIKPLGNGLPEQPGVTGGAIMPDGRVGLILDAAGLVGLAHEKRR